MYLKKALKNSVVFCLIASCLCFPAFGATTTVEKKVLPLKEAIKSATNTSTSLKLLEKEGDTNRYVLNHTDTNTYQNYDLANTIKKNDQSVSYYKDKIEYLTESIYNQLIISEKNLALLNKEIESTKKDLEIMKLKLELGIIDEVSLKNKEAALDESNNNKITTEVALQTLKEDFKLLTNLDPDKYILENTMTYEPFRATGDNIKGYITKRLNDMQLYDEEYAKYFEDTIGARITMPNSNQISESSYANAVLKKNQLYGQMETKYDSNLQLLLDKYSTLIKTEKAIENTKSQIELTNKNIDILKLKLDKGLATQIEYDNLLLKKEQLENTLMNSIYTHNDLKRVLDKPWVSLS